MGEELFKFYSGGLANLAPAYRAKANRELLQAKSKGKIVGGHPFSSSARFNQPKKNGGSKGKRK